MADGKNKAAAAAEGKPSNGPASTAPPSASPSPPPLHHYPTLGLGGLAGTPLLIMLQQHAEGLLHTENEAAKLASLLQGKRPLQISLHAEVAVKDAGRIKEEEEEGEQQAACLHVCV